jgi:hypothetical protein
MLVPNFIKSLPKAFIYIGCFFGSILFIPYFMGKLPTIVLLIAWSSIAVLCGFLGGWYYRKYLKWKKWAVEQGW